MRAPYKRYVYGSSFIEANSSDEEEAEEDVLMEEVETELTVINRTYGEKDVYGNTKGALNKLGMFVSSVYVLTENQQPIIGQLWPRSKFEKVDVLRHALLSQIEEETAIAEEQSEMLILPLELILRVFDILYLRGKLKPKYLRLSKFFYRILLPIIYKRPLIKSTNFFAFMDTISGSKTVGGFVHELDLSYVNQLGKNAFVAKLLKRTKESLEVFISPQTSFGFGPLMAIKSCEQLKVLDLRLVSETLNLKELFASIKNLKNLQHLSFPRSSIEMDDIGEIEKIEWPPSLLYLRISGSISDEFLVRTILPPTIKQLEFAHCPLIKDIGFHHILSKQGDNLTSLKVQFPMRCLKTNSLDFVFTYCPNLISLEVCVDYISNTFFDEENLPLMSYPRPLRALYLNSSGMLGTSSKVEPIDLALALNEGRLPLLKNLNITSKLGWSPNSDDVTFIVDELEERNGGLYVGY